MLRFHIALTDFLVQGAAHFRRLGALELGTQLFIAPVCNSGRVIRAINDAVLVHGTRLAHGCGHCIGRKHRLLLGHSHRRNIDDVLGHGLGSRPCERALRLLHRLAHFGDYIPCGDSLESVIPVFSRVGLAVRPHRDSGSRQSQRLPGNGCSLRRHCRHVIEAARCSGGTILAVIPG
ncbi:hypothetical protein D3C72_570850 [compost metagenome]